MLEITSHRQGAILNHNHGVETEGGLTITVSGISESGRKVKINDVPAVMDGRLFSAEVTLTEKINPITASVMTPYGEYTQKITLVWDKKSFPRYQFYIDDHSFLFTELTRQRPKRAFDHFYLAGLKKIHEESGLKVTLNTFYRNDHDKEGFLLNEMPDIWKSEFQDNSDWLKMSFHSYSEFPDRPYIEASAEEFGRDYDLVKDEIIRFAGEETFMPPTVIHWGSLHPSAAAELIRRGSKCFNLMFRPKISGGPSLAERMNGTDMNKVQALSLSGADTMAPTEGLEMHFDCHSEKDYLKRHSAYYDPALDMFFTSGIGLCCNLVPLEEIPGKVASALETASRYGVETLKFATHEQYTFPHYPNYLPDHMERIALSARLFHEKGFTSVFFNDGLLGNMAWESK